MRTLSIFEVPKEEAKSFSPVRELSQLIRLPYRGVSGLRGDMGLLKLAYTRTGFWDPAELSGGHSSNSSGGEGGSVKLGLFMIFFCLPKDGKGCSGMLTKVKMVASTRVIDVKM